MRIRVKGRAHLVSRGTGTDLMPARIFEAKRVGFDWWFWMTIWPASGLPVQWMSLIELEGARISHLRQTR